MNQEKIIQIQMIEQEANQLNEQVRLIEQNIREMAELKESLEEIEKLKKGDEILANLGKRIFIPVEVKDKNLIVDVGNRKFVKKSVLETGRIIDEQTEDLMNARGQIAGRLEDLQEEMKNLIDDIQNEERKNDKR